MLAPIARLLHISLDILLSFHENLTDLEIEELIHKMDKMFSEESFEKTYQWDVNTIKEYPNCNLLIWQLAAMAVNIPLLLPSPVAVLQRLWQLCGEGEFWYTVLTSLCRILLGFAAGAMLYVVVEEMIPEMSQGRHSHIGVLAFAAGFSVMMVLDVALG